MYKINHRGFSPLPNSLHHLQLDGSLASDLKWEIQECPPNTLWELDFQIQALIPAHLASHQLAVKVFAKSLWEKFQKESLGVILYKGEVPPFPLDAFADYLHLLAAYLPDELPAFALFNTRGDPLLFSKELFPHIHLGFSHPPYGALQWGERLKPQWSDGKIGVVLPPQEKGVSFTEIESLLPMPITQYRLIAESFLTEEWDELEEILIFPKWISSMGRRMVQGFEATGGKVTQLFE